MSGTFLQVWFRPVATRLNDITHLYCDCDPDLALCGLDITDFDEDDDVDAYCIVCDDLADLDCERCGA